MKLSLFHACAFILTGCVTNSLWAQGRLEGSVRDAAASARYVPAIPSKLKPEWEPWRKEAQSLIEVVGVGAQSRASAEDIGYEAIRAGVDPELVFSAVEVLSRFDEFATSPKGGNEGQGNEQGNERVMRG